MPKKFKFGGGDKCVACEKTVYVQEKVVFEGKFYHDQCFKCHLCNKKIDSPNNAGSMDGKVFHRKCFQIQFSQTGGKYGGKKVENRSKTAEAKAAEPAAAPAAAKPTPAPAKEPEPTPAPAPEPVVEAKEEAPAPAPVKKKKTKKKREPSPEREKVVPKYEGGSRKAWFFENVDKKLARQYTEPIVLRPEVSDTVYLGSLDGTINQLVVQIEGKCKSVTVNNCKKVAIIANNVVANIGIVRSSRIQFQVTGSVPIVQIDKTDQSTVYLSEACLALDPTTSIYSAASSGINIVFPTADNEDSVEAPLPEQTKSVVSKTGSVEHQLVIAGEE